MYPSRFKPGKTPSDVERTLRFVVRSAGRNIPAYRALLDRSDVVAARVRGVGDLPSLPIVEKEPLLRGAPLRDRLHRSADPSRCVRASTSGATGLPVDIYMSRAEALFRRAQLLAAWRRFARLPLALRIVDVGVWSTDESGCRLVRHGPISILRISIALPIDEQLRLLTRHAPHVVSGPPTALELLAERLVGTRASRSVRLVVTRGEVLHAPVRAALENAFACRLADFYNCEEVGNVASECPEDPGVFHINTDACVVEVTDEDGCPLPPGEEGRILVTNLYNCTMPLIRYDVGDRGALLPAAQDGRCICGSRRPRMGALDGRDEDYVILPDGRRVSPRLIANTVYRASTVLPSGVDLGRSIRRFQVVQDAVDHVIVRIIPEPDGSMDFEEAIPRALRGLHPALRSSIALVDELPLEPSGKFKKIVRSFESSDEAA